MLKIPKMLRNISNDTGASVFRGRRTPARKFGEIPEWAKTGRVTLTNYDLRAEAYGVKVKQWGDNWPFLSHDPDIRATANEDAWSNYFWDHLGGYPPSFQLFRNGTIRFFNCPEERPEVFDPSYDRG